MFVYTLNSGSVTIPTSRLIWHASYDDDTLLNDVAVIELGWSVRGCALGFQTFMLKYHHITVELTTLLTHKSSKIRNCIFSGVNKYKWIYVILNMI